MANRPDGGRGCQRDGELEYCGCHSRWVESACECASGGRRGTGRPGASMRLSHVNSRLVSPVSAFSSCGSAEPFQSSFPQLSSMAAGLGAAVQKRLSLEPNPAGTSVLLALKPRVPLTAQGWGFRRTSSLDARWTPYCPSCLVACSTCCCAVLLDGHPD